MRALFAGALSWAGSVLAQEPAPPTPESMELGIHLGYARASADGEGEVYGGPGARVHLLWLLGPYLSAGGEVGMYSEAGSRTRVRLEGGAHINSPTNDPLLQVGAIARLGVDLQGFRPAVTFGLGYNRAAVENIGYSIGFELQMTPVKWLPLSVDMRLHESLNSYGYEADEKIEFLTLGLGWRLAW